MLEVRTERKHQRDERRQARQGHNDPQGGVLVRSPSIQPASHHVCHSLRSTGMTPAPECTDDLTWRRETRWT